MANQTNGKSNIQTIITGIMTVLAFVGGGVGLQGQQTADQAEAQVAEASLQLKMINESIEDLRTSRDLAWKRFAECQNQLMNNE